MATLCWLALGGSQGLLLISRSNTVHVFSAGNLSQKALYHARLMGVSEGLIFLSEQAGRNMSVL